MNERTVPTASDITKVKSKKILNEVMEVVNKENLRDVTKIITAKMEEEDCTALELAAAFLKLQLGEEKQDIVSDRYVVKHKPFSKKKKEWRGRKR